MKYTQGQWTFNPIYHEPNQLYFAYGMNTNHGQMATRCKDSIFIGHGVLEGFKLDFHGVATYNKSKKHNLHGAVWLISQSDEKQLDSLEGYHANSKLPNLYDKYYIEPRIVWSRIPRIENLISTKVSSKVMIYKMTGGSLSLPMEHYWNMLSQGYKQSRLPYRQLYNAVKSIVLSNNKDEENNAICVQ